MIYLAHGASGTAQSMIVAGLVTNTAYYFALKTSDEVPNISALSDVATGTTLASAGDTPPAFVTAWGTGGSGNGQFAYPYRVATDAAGNVYVADSGNNRIQKFTSTGTYLTQWGTYGTGNGQFYYPWGVATDAAGNVYVADTFNERIQKFAPVP